MAGSFPMLSASSLVHAAPAIVGRQTPSALAHDSAAPAALYHRGLEREAGAKAGYRGHEDPANTHESAQDQ